MKKAKITAILKRSRNLCLFLFIHNLPYLYFSKRCNSSLFGIPRQIFALHITLPDKHWLWKANTTRGFSNDVESELVNIEIVLNADDMNIYYPFNCGVFSYILSYRGLVCLVRLFYLSFFYFPNLSVVVYAPQNCGFSHVSPQSHLALVHQNVRIMGCANDGTG